MSEKNEIAKVGKSLPSVDNGEFASLLDTSKFEHLYRIATMFSKSDLIPQQFKGNPGNCMIALQMAFRLGIDPMQLMQSCYVIHGKPTVNSQLAIGLLNSSGRIRGSIEYEFSGEGDEYGCHAFATTADGKLVKGPRVTWKTVKAEGWDKKTGSKWKTLPDLMFRYRAAMFLIRTHFPESVLGMYSREELEDEFHGEQAVPAGKTKAEIIAAEIRSNETKEDVEEVEHEEV